MDYIKEYIKLVEEEEYPVCKEQKLLVKFIKRIFKEEKDDLYIDEEKAEKYLSYQKYFPYKLFPWEKFILVLTLCLYRKDGTPRFDTSFTLVGR